LQAGKCLTMFGIGFEHLHFHFGARCLASTSDKISE